MASRLEKRFSSKTILYWGVQKIILLKEVIDDLLSYF